MGAKVAERLRCGEQATREGKEREEGVPPLCCYGTHGLDLQGQQIRDLPEWVQGEYGRIDKEVGMLLSSLCSKRQI